jgi:rubrerythrin
VQEDRRELLRRGVGLGGAVVAASAIPLLFAVRDAFAQGDTDASLLGKAIGLERVAVLAYDTLLGRGLLAPPATTLMQTLRGHEQAHAVTLTRALTDLGGTPPPKVGPGDVEKVVAGLGDIASEKDALTFAVALETAAIAAYYDAQAKFVEAKLLQDGAMIMAAEGQHLVVLRRALGLPPVPRALETGAR